MSINNRGLLLSFRNDNSGILDLSHRNDSFNMGGTDSNIMSVLTLSFRNDNLNSAQMATPMCRILDDYFSVNSTPLDLSFRNDKVDGYTKTRLSHRNDSFNYVVFYMVDCLNSTPLDLSFRNDKVDGYTKTRLSHRNDSFNYVVFYMVDCLNSTPLDLSFRNDKLITYLIQVNFLILML